MIQISSPTRVDLAGGTLDMWPLYMCVEQAMTINLAISIQTHVELTPLSGSSQILIQSDDLKKTFEFDTYIDLLNQGGPEVQYYKKVIQYFQPKVGLRLRTRSESPVGGGLGGSSSLLISLMKAFSKMTGQDCGTPAQMAQVAHNLEASILRTPTGTQDYVPAISGGLNLIEYGPRGMKIETIDPDPSWAEHFLLVYTGRSHHSGLNNFEVLKAVVAGDQKVLSALQSLAEISLELKSILVARRWDQFSQIFQKEYTARIALAEAFSSPEIRRLQDLALSSGISSVKICGAGGGGCVLIWCDTKKQKQEVEEKCRKEGFQLLQASPLAPL